MKKVFVYHRVSSDQQLDGSGIARQAELLEGYLDRTGICSEMDDPIPVVLSDQGVSAFKGLNISEGELGAWMEEVRNGMWDSSILVVESIDRFSRQNPFDVMGYINALMAHNVAIHDVMANIVISRSNSKDLPFVMMNAQRAYDESKYKSDRIRKGWAKKREQAFNKGTIVTNKRPQWIDVEDDKYVLNHKAAVIKEIFELYKTGLGCPTIAKELQKKEGERYKFNRAWTGELVHKILTNRRVTGKIFISETIRNHDDLDNPVTQKKYQMDVYPVVVNEDEFELVQQLLKSRRPNSGRVTVKKTENEEVLIKSNLFSGIARCTECGGSMYHNVVRAKRTPKKGEPKVDEYRYIRCLNERDGLCENKAMTYETVERFVVEHIIGMNLSTVMKEQEFNPEVEVLRVQIDQVKDQITNYENGIERRKSSGKAVSFEMREELDDAKLELEELLARQASLATVHVDVPVLQDVNVTELYDVYNVDMRTRYENELNKIVSNVRLKRNGNYYSIDITYKQNELKRHVLFVEHKKKEQTLISEVIIEDVDSSTFYSTPSFMIRATKGEIRFQQTNEDLSIIDYSLMMNYVDTLEGADTVAVWMRHNMNFLFT
ncbi:recombinase family protein [Citrobacter koseri]|uniref:recombinase family protein n=1 Tax=Citrobacter koseri TaxID=545 RepID=UPI001904F5B9|nr:recombinase family protein [Citrobacter koseri]MBJ9105972.1 recombinase family protein [Citrobacter koseri]MBJ9121283.1 recombinase family protein [Citrobacter koseri]